MRYHLIVPVFLLLIGSNFLGHAQTAEQVENHYYNFSQHRLFGTDDEVIREGEILMTMLDKFSRERQTFITYCLANTYENNGQMEKAVPLYLNVIEAEPAYHVPYRALGHYYLKQSNETAEKLNASKNATERKKLMEEYHNICAKALSYLEKDYACDPYEGTLETINRLMKTLGEKAKPNEFKQRIAKLAEDCVSVLTDEGSGE